MAFPYYLVSLQSYLAVWGVAGSPLKIIDLAASCSELSHLIKDVALEPTVSRKPAFLRGNGLCKLSFWRTFPLINSLAQAGGSLELGKGQQRGRSELDLQRCSVLFLGLTTCRIWVCGSLSCPWSGNPEYTDRSSSDSLVQNRKLQRNSPTPLPPCFGFVWVKLPVEESFSLLNIKSILRREMLEERIMEAETRCKGVINTEAKVEEKRELAKKMSSVTLVNTVL